MAGVDETYFDRIGGTIILLVLIALAFFLLRPILLSIITGLLLAFIFTPPYKWLSKKTHSKNFSALLIIIFIIAVIVAALWFLTPVLIEQSFKIFQAILQIDFITPLKKLFPTFFVSEQFSTQIASVISSFLTKTVNSVIQSFTSILLDLPTVLLQLLVVLFTFFFVLRDNEKVVEYAKSLLPFPKEIENKLFRYSSEITKSVIYSHIFIGAIQGVIAGIGFFIFGVPNAVFLTFLGIVTGILPIIGTPVVWIPVAVFFFIGGNNLGGWGVVFFGVLSSIVENILRPIFVARMTKLHSAIVLISMIGGVFFFGILGFILGPLIIAYLIIVLELYRKKPLPGLISPPESEKKETK